MQRYRTPLRLYVLPLFILLGLGCADILSLDDYGGAGAIQVEDPPDNTYTCHCVCDGNQTNTSERDLEVCLPASLNPVLGGVAATQADANADCSGRVTDTLDEMSRVCRLRVDCNCGAAPGLRYAAECDTPCVENTVDVPGCMDFSFDAAFKDATNTTTTEPVCTVASSDPPTPTPDPLAASGIFGHRTRCDVGGSVIAMIDDDEQTQPAQGVVEFDGGPCPGVGCATGMAYQLDVDPFEFSGFLGLVTVSLEDITTAGATQPAAAMLDPAGVGQVAALATLSSGRATRVEEDLLGTDESTSALIGSNVEPIGIIVDWTNNQCAISGTVLGSTNEDSELAVTVNLLGTIVNEPPAADAGSDQTIECTSPDGADVVLDASGSTDPDPNLALVGWRRGDPFSQNPADEFGPDDFGATYTVLQDFGTESYHLLVIDAYMQASPDSFSATVEDTTPPVISDVTATPDSLWPPNHKFWTIGVDITATDTCDSDPECQVVSVTSNEPVNGKGDGNTSPDWIITGDFSVELRSERSGKRSGRIYTIGVECTDDFGNTSASSVNVTVAHDQS
jgi:hypothetical protein